jgi:hypothetical protein
MNKTDFFIITGGGASCWSARAVKQCGRLPHSEGLNMHTTSNLPRVGNLREDCLSGVTLHFISNASTCAHGAHAWAPGWIARRILAGRVPGRVCLLG